MKLTRKQKEFWNNCSHRWNIKCGATRSGKTYLDYFLIPKRIRAVAGKEGLTVFLGNTRSTLQRNIVEPLQSKWGEALVSNIKADNTAMMFGEKVYCIGADKRTQVDRLRGSAIKYCYGDEIVTWNQEVFEMLKSRLDKEYSKFDGTCNPEHPKHWLKQFVEQPNIDIFYQQYSIYDNDFLPKEIIKNLEQEYEGTIYFERYILGKWCKSSGIIFPVFAGQPEKWIVEKSKVPRFFKWCEVGFDLGGNGSAYALTCTAEGNDGKYYVLKSKKVQAGELDMADIEKMVVEFCEEVEKDYNVKIRVINCDHIAVIVNSINDNTRFIADLTYKPPLEDRPYIMTKLLAQHKISFVKNKCDDLIDELCDLVFDEKSTKAIPLDDGTMQIDTWDSWTYSISNYWNYLNI